MLAIISRLDLAASDRRRLEAIRRTHDPQHGFVRAHFTHVFPFDGENAEAVAAHAATVARLTPEIGFRLSTAKAVRDPISGAWLVFLLASAGEGEIAALHDHLYLGLLASKLRGDLPYRPHVTIAKFNEPDEAERLANSLGAVDIAGRLSSIDLVAIDGGRLADLGRFRLGGATPAGSL